MSEIPDDVMERATACLSAAQWNPKTVADIARAILAERAAERERCWLITPEPDIEGKPANAYEEGYKEGFHDCVARYRSGIDPSRPWWHPKGSA